MFKLLTGLNPTTWAITGLAALMLLGATFATGYYLGDTHDARIVAQAQAQAVQNATSAQAKADSERSAKDRNAAVADAMARGKADQAASDAASKLQASIPALLAVVRPKPVKPVNGMCPIPPQPIIPASVMHGLNDPALIGGP